MNDKLNIFFFEKVNFHKYSLCPIKYKIFNFYTISEIFKIIKNFFNIPVNLNKKYH